MLVRAWTCGEYMSSTIAAGIANEPCVTARAI